MINYHNLHQIEAETIGYYRHRIRVLTTNSSIFNYFFQTSVANRPNVELSSNNSSYLQRFFPPQTFFAAQSE